jgi:hypothetical protein
MKSLAGRIEEAEWGAAISRVQDQTNGLVAHYDGGPRSTRSTRSRAFVYHRCIFTMRYYTSRCQRTQTDEKQGGRPDKHPVIASVVAQISCAISALTAPGTGYLATPARRDKPEHHVGRRHNKRSGCLFRFGSRRR